MLIKVISIYEHFKGQEGPRPRVDTGQPGLSTVLSSASDQPALSRTCGPRIIGSGILGIFRLVPKSVVSKSGFRKAAPLSGPSLGT
jgi:hypothetical protein